LDFGFSEEQEMLRDAAKRFLADNCPTKFVRQMMADPTGHDAAFWKKLVELGWPGLLIPESYGGQGGSFLDMTVIVEEAGKALVPGPLFTSALLAAPLLIEGGSDQQKKDLLPRMAKGEFIGTVAIAEAAGRFDAEGIQLKATKSGNEYTITGEKFFVPDAHVANGMAVAVRTGGSGEKGITILAMNAKTPGITITQLKDGRFCGARSTSQPRGSRPRWSGRRSAHSTCRWTTPRRECNSASRSDRSRPSSTSASI
jgi:alkylation response protein AidB-like acyl-CoA dehydrogenase